MKEPIWINKVVSSEKEAWKRDSLNTVPKYSILVCDPNTLSACYSAHNLGQWMSSVLAFPDYIRLSELVMIWEVSWRGKYLLMLCPYCNPCNPFEVILYEASSQNLRPVIDQAMDDVDQISPQSIGVVLYYDTNMYKHIRNKDQRTRKALMNHLKQIQGNDVIFFPFSTDIHLISLLVPENLSLHFAHFGNA